MARRRVPNQDDEGGMLVPSPGAGPGGTSIFDNGAGFSDMGPNIGSILEDFELPDFTKDPIAGNSEVARMIFGTRGPRTGTTPAMPQRNDPIAPGPMPEPGGGQGPDIGAIVSQLPQGVEAQEQDMGMGSAGASVAPMQGSAPQSVSMRGTPPSTMPSRQPAASPVSLFGGGGNSPSLIGRDEGLFGGGRGMPGGPGTPQATEQMLALLEQLGL